MLQIMWLHDPAWWHSALAPALVPPTIANRNEAQIRRNTSASDAVEGTSIHDARLLRQRDWL
jgi:hypothetical protein